MNSVIRTKRVFLSGQLVEYWENADLPFGWARDDLQAYLDRGQWMRWRSTRPVPGPATARDMTPCPACSGQEETH